MSWCNSIKRRMAKHSGATLMPPLGGPERLAELGPLVASDVDITGTSWKTSTVDVAIAGAPHLLLQGLVLHIHLHVVEHLR